MITLDPARNYKLSELADATGIPGATLRSAANAHHFGWKTGGIWWIRAQEFRDLLSTITTPKAKEVLTALRLKGEEKPILPRSKPRPKKKDSLGGIASKVGKTPPAEGDTLKAPSGLVVYPDRDYRLARLAPCFKVRKDWLMATCRDAGIVRKGQIGGKGHPCSIVRGDHVIPILRRAMEKGKDTDEPYGVPRPEQVEIPSPLAEHKVVQAEAKKPRKPHRRKPDPKPNSVPIHRPDTPDAALDAFRLCNMILSRCHGNVARAVVRSLVKTYLRNEPAYDVSDLSTLLKKIEDGGSSDTDDE